MARKVLVADDSLTIQKVIELTFSEENYQVTAYANGRDALNHLRGEQPDILLADVVMPEMDGYTLCREAKTLYPDLPVLLLTGTFEPFDRAKAVSSGFNDVVVKPFDSQALIQKVEGLLSKAPAQPPAAEEVPAPPPQEIFAAPLEAAPDLAPLAPPTGGFPQDLPPMPEPPPIPPPPPIVPVLEETAPPFEELPQAPVAYLPPPTASAALEDDLFSVPPPPPGTMEEFAPPPAASVYEEALPAPAPEPMYEEAPAMVVPPQAAPPVEDYYAPVPEPSVEEAPYVEASVEAAASYEEPAPEVTAYEEPLSAPMHGEPPTLPAEEPWTAAPGPVEEEIPPAPPAEEPWAATPAPVEEGILPAPAEEPIPASAYREEAPPSVEEEIPPAPVEEPVPAPAYMEETPPSMEEVPPPVEEVSPAVENVPPPVEEVPPMADEIPPPIVSVLESTAPVPPAEVPPRPVMPAVTTASTGPVLVELSPAQMDIIVKAVVEKMSDEVVRQIAWDVVPELAELLVKQRMKEIEEKES